MQVYDAERCETGKYNVLIFSKKNKCLQVILSDTYVHACEIGKEEIKGTKNFYVVYRVLQNSLLAYDKWAPKKV